MKEVKSSESQPLLLLPYLPEEIITDILTNLPVKTLIRFRCVSKSWINLISTPNFINTHLVNSSNSNKFDQQKVVLWLNLDLTIDRPLITHSYYLKSLPLHSLFYQTSAINNSGNGHSLKLYYRSNSIVGSCNGLVCILMENAFLIWNPSTGEFKMTSVLIKSLNHSSFGFGYDKLSDDYKVVQKEFDLVACKNVFKVYSLRTNSNRLIWEFRTRSSYHRMGKFANGVLYWLVWDELRIVPSYVILSFDLGNETYGEIDPPNYGGGISYADLIVVEGCISMCCKFSSIRTDIWVMKECGIRDSWVKLYTIPSTHIPNKNVCFHYVLLCNPVTGEILLKHDDMLMIYHSKYGTFENKRIRDMLSSIQGATTYVESLVSPCMRSGVQEFVHFNWILMRKAETRGACREPELRLQIQSTDL